MKLLIKLAVLVLFLLITLGIAGYFLVPPAASKAASEGSRYAFGQDASLESVGAKFGLSATDVGFRGYSLDSPAGFEEKLLTIGEFKLGLGTRSLISDTKSVGEFVLDDVQLTLVQHGVENNLVPVLRHLQRLTSGGAGSAEGGSTDGEDSGASDEDGAPGPRLKVGKVRVEGVGARLILDGIPGVAALDKTFEIPAYEADFSDVMGDDGLTVAEIAGLMVTDLKERAMVAAGDHVPAPVLSALEKTLDGGFEGGLDGALNAGRDALEAEAGKRINELEGEAQKVVEDAKGALDKKVDGVRKEAENALGGAVEEANKKAGDLLKKGLGGVLGGDGR